MPFASRAKSNLSNFFGTAAPGTSPDAADQQISPGKRFTSRAGEVPGTPCNPLGFAPWAASGLVRKTPYVPACRNPLIEVLESPQCAGYGASSRTRSSWLPCMGSRGPHADRLTPGGGSGACRPPAPGRADPLPADPAAAGSSDRFAAGLAGNPLRPQNRQQLRASRHRLRCSMSCLCCS